MSTLEELKSALEVALARDELDRADQIMAELEVRGYLSHSGVTMFEEAPEQAVVKAALPRKRGRPRKNP